MNFISTIKTLGSSVADLVFPIYCISCGKEGKGYLCADCVPKLEKLDKQICVICASPSPYGKTHPECASRNTVDGVISALPYTNPQTKKLIEIFKYNFVSDLANPLTKLLVMEINRQGLENYFKEFTLIPVPLHQKRFNWRGFNQAELISVELQKALGIPLTLDLVQRIKSTKPQVDLNRDQRKQNITNAFQSPAPVSGKFLLVDDVVTSGSTLNEIAKVLKKASASEVWAATIAHG